MKIFSDRRLFKITSALCGAVFLCAAALWGLLAAANAINAENAPLYIAITAAPLFICALALLFMTRKAVFDDKGIRYGRRFIAYSDIVCCGVSEPRRFRDGVYVWFAASELSDEDKIGMNSRLSARLPVIAVYAAEEQKDEILGYVRHNASNLPQPEYFYRTAKEPAPEGEKRSFALRYTCALIISLCCAALACRYGFYASENTESPDILKLSLLLAGLIAVCALSTYVYFVLIKYRRLGKLSGLPFWLTDAASIGMAVGIIKNIYNKSAVVTVFVLAAFLVSAFYRAVTVKLCSENASGDEKRE